MLVRYRKKHITMEDRDRDCVDNGRHDGTTGQRSVERRRKTTKYYLHTSR